MLRSKQCPKCGSRRIAGPHRIYGQQHVRIDLPGVLSATLEAITCADCGYTELYADRLGLDNLNKVGRFLDNLGEHEPRICPYCGTQISSDAVYCPECGNTI